MTMLKEIKNYLTTQLTGEVLQEISDKMWTIGHLLKSDGKGLSGGLIMEQTLFEILSEHVDGFDAHHEGQSDCKVNDITLSFKKITGKSTLALNWSKNESGANIVRFECPILLMNLKEGRWWKNKKDANRSLPSGFYLISHDYCNENVKFKTNNKTNSLIVAEDIYKMMVEALDLDVVLELPPARTNRFSYTFNQGFEEVVPSISKWPVLEFEPGRPRFIDLFCGVGGFHYAVTQAGGRCVFACDIDSHCRQNYLVNFGTEPEQDIRTVKADAIPPFDLLCAGFPCQPFSKAGDQDGFEDKTKGNLFYEIVRILRHHKPSGFILENVKNIVTHDNGKTWQTIRGHLRDLGYTVYDKPIILSPRHMGTPQSRERAIITGRLGPLPPFPNPLIKETCIKTVLTGEADQYRLRNRHHDAGVIWEEFCEVLRKHEIAIPRFPIWTDDWDKTLAETDSHYQKYKVWIDKNKVFYESHKEILEPWLRRSRDKTNWIGCMRKLEWQCDNTSLKDSLWTFRGSGIRVRDLAYSPTLVAMPMIPVYGPEWRWLTPREVCRLQDFPDSYHFHEKHCYKQMGNAVNVKVIHHVVEWLCSL